MNYVGKILVVLIFVMSLVFMSFALMVYATHKNWKDVVERPQTQTGGGLPLGLRHQLAEMKSNVERLEGEKQALETQKKQELEAKTVALTQLETRKAALEAERAQLTKERDDYSEKEKKAIAALDTASQNLQKLTQEVGVLRDQIRDAQEKRDEQFARVVVLTDAIHQSQHEVELLKERNTQLVAQVTHARDLLAQYGKNIGDSLDPTPPPLRGKVLAINDNRMVEISLGSDDGLAAGHTVEVFRGSKYVGRLVVLTTKTDKSVGKIDTKFTKIPVQTGDDVATKLRISDHRARDAKATAPNAG